MRCPGWHHERTLPPVSEDVDHREKIVLVEWHDARMDTDVRSVDDIRPDYPVRTVGFLIATGPLAVSIAAEVLPDGDGWRAVTTIPLAVVDSIVDLTEFVA